MTENKELTQAISNNKERWEVWVDRKMYVLNEKQVQVLKDADTAGMRGVVWFRDFAISIPHISSVRLVQARNEKNEFLQIPEESSSPISKQELERIEAIKQKIRNKLKIN